MASKPLAKSLRFSSNLLHLWALCGKPACRRARTCRRNPEQCTARYAPLVPEEARLGALAFDHGFKDGAPAEAVRFHAHAETAALAAWTARVASSLDGCQARGTCDDKASLKG